MFGLLNTYRRRRWLRQAELGAGEWGAVLDSMPAVAWLTPVEQARLQDLALLFLREKAITPAAGVELSPARRLGVAARAVLPILNLSLDYYCGWAEVIVYPGAFVPGHEYTDDAGVVHVDPRPRAGESWLRGPVILSWHDMVEDARHPEHGRDVVIHEMAHKLDMLNGDANGLPPLHADMSLPVWAEAFTAAYGALCAQVDAGAPTLLDPYAAEAPGEFFAVASETFFTLPQALRQVYPAVYAQLQAYYRLDLAARAGAQD